MTELAAEHGLSPAVALAGTGVDEARLQAPEEVVQARQELRLIRNLVETLDHVPALGVLAGKRYHFTAFGSLGFAMVSSPTARDALDVGLKYIRLTAAFCRFELTDTGRHTHVVMDDADIPGPLRRFIVERDSACVITLQRDMFGTETVLESLRFAFADPGYTDAYEDFYRIRPAYGARINEAVMDRGELTQRLPQANELALRMAEQQCEMLLNQRRARGGLGARVRNHLAARAAEMPTMADVAEHLCMIPRTLRRRLAAEDTRFAELRDEVRQTLAEEYLSGPRLSVEQIAERLGYAEATSFINAYKRWYGVPPGRGRRPESARPF
ncbi:MAG: AraC family transcriptional regulator [Salinisphaeraceae bacterium]